MKYEIISSFGHGKNVKGNKKTSTIQVIERFSQGYFLITQFRYVIGDDESRSKAIEKAKSFVAKHCAN